MPQQKTYRFVIEIPGTSPRSIKSELVYYLKSSRLTPKDAGPYYWDAHIKEYSRVISRRDPDSQVALAAAVEKATTILRDTADNLEKINQNLTKTPKLKIDNTKKGKSQP
jgi:hypothetical protein